MSLNNRNHRFILCLNLLFFNHFSQKIYSLSVGISDNLNAKRIVQVYYDSSNDLHRDLKYHPEQPERIYSCVKELTEYYQNNYQSLLSSSISSRGDTSVIENTLQENDSLPILLDICNVASSSSSTTKDFIMEESYQKGCCLVRKNQVITKEELDYARSILVTIHSEEYVSQIEQRCRRSRQQRIDEGKNPLGFVGYIDDDTYLTSESHDVCLRATAIWIRALQKAIDTTTTVATFALTRPPGHHATSTLSNGFCIYNFAAAAAIHTIQNLSSSSSSIPKVSILDWDVHYGQGTADIVQHYPEIRYVSLHQNPAFPYQGQTRSIKGIHRNIYTLPLPPDSTWSCGYQQYFQQYVLPFVYDSSSWIPDVIIISAGYDALSSDELASCELRSKDYGTMITLLREWIQQQQQQQQLDYKTTPAIMVGLEGGYQLQQNKAGGNLQEAILETIKALH